MLQKTFLQNPATASQSRAHHRLDAKGHVLGRLATRAADLLRGKHKPIYTSSVDCGDFVEIWNAASVKLTGNKMEQKFYFSHSGYAGGKKTTPVARVMERDPRKVVYLAVKRMIPSNRLRDRQLARLRIHKGEAPQGAASAAKSS
ncbi:MAG: 50S ribosomal protein L13 [Elusimicrobia bacterium]|nr:50S ribosomal protein L13 [Elusimicrobiota bacterium]